MKLKKTFLSIILSLLTLSNSFAMQPVGLANGAEVCYANASIQLLFAIPGFENYLLTKNSDISNKLVGLYNSYESGNPDNNIKMQIIREVMEENIAVQNHFDFMKKLFIKIDPYNNFIDMIRELNIVLDVNKNHIANIVHTGGHYFAEIKHEEQWYKVDDAGVTRIDNPTVKNIQDQTKQVISISLSNGIDNHNRYDEDFELAIALSLSSNTDRTNTDTEDSDIDRAIALSLSSGTDRTNTDTEDSDFDRAIALSLSSDAEKISHVKQIIENEEIYSIYDLSKLQGLTTEDDAFILMTTPEYRIEETEFLSEQGFEKLVEIIAQKI